MALFEFSLFVVCGLFMLKIHSLILLSRMKQKVSVNVVFLDLFDLFLKKYFHSSVAVWLGLGNKTTLLG